MAFTEEGLSALIFAETEVEALADLQHRFPLVEFVSDNRRAEVLGEKIFLKKEIPQLLLHGTSFQQTVWKVLMTIPEGTICTYKEIAEAIGKPKAVRAVGTAIGANPISYMIPCHRVIRSDGKLGGYRWGLERKVQMLKAEGLTKAI
ncbi:Bifunctional transcriptional activator/DNA repair enzyme Ada [bioreactor metagenome]|uniref:methylated-DNA--[protein]-cysteine S-methyltransferase n=1 Tax=bioreactor metagenome TaxID=1076179 RepID=A0A645F1A3_9ZZZZ